MKRKRKICELKSFKPNVKCLNVIEGQNLIIGRNKECEIRDLRCSRQLFEITVRPENVYLTHLKNNSTKILKNGEYIQGHGFEYKCLIEQEEYDVCSDDDELIKNENDQFTLSKECNDIGEWQAFDDNSVYVYSYKGGGQCSSKLAAFDFDGTLVVTKSGKKFAMNQFDWRLFDLSIIDRIKQFIDNNYRFVIVSNQGGVSSGHSKLADIQQRFEAAIKRINIPCLAMFAVKHNIYRKPRPGMFYLYQNCLNDGIQVEQSFFIGDAAGRKTSLRKDHSADDILFALNNKFQAFQTPEDFIAKKEMENVGNSVILYNSNLPHFNPKTLLTTNEIIATSDDGKTYKSIDELLNSMETTNYILFVGLPASGKSFFFNKHLAKRGYKQISRDQLGNMDKCEIELKRLLNEGETKIVINNMNLEENTRRKYFELIPKLNVFYFEADKMQCLHLNQYRRLMKQINPDLSYSPVPDMVIFSSIKKLNEPSKEEGFERIYKINFIASFESEQEKELFQMFL